MRSEITDRFESRSALEHYEAALEASCDALIALQLISASKTSSCAEGKQLEGQSARAIKPLRRTIKALRGAIEELRAAQNEGPSTLIIGFVLGADVEDAGCAEAPGRSIQAAPDRVGRRVDAARETELREDARDVVLDRPRTDVEDLRDLAVLEPAGDQAQHIQLPRG